MKKLSILLLFCLFIFSCENNTEIENSIQGKWNVTQIIGGFSQPKNYNENEVTWFFNLNEKNVTIVNSVDIFDTLHIPSFTNNQGGVYPFEITTENNIEYLVVGERKGIIKLIDNELWYCCRRYCI
jgi:hypothetical protein